MKKRKGFVVSLELLLILSILTFGLVEGLIALKDAMNDQFYAIAGTIKNLNVSINQPKNTTNVTNNVTTSNQNIINLTP